MRAPGARPGSRTGAHRPRYKGSDKGTGAAAMLEPKSNGDVRRTERPL